MAKINNQWPWPNNVGVLGTHPEELKNLQKLEKSLEASPLAEAEPTQFLDPRKSSDHLRIGLPKVVGEETEISRFVLLHVIFRRILMKRRRRGWMLFDEAVDEEDLEDVPHERRGQMRSMLAREQAMLDILDNYNSLAEDVYMRLLSESKG